MAQEYTFAKPKELDTALQNVEKVFAELKRFKESMESAFDHKVQVMIIASTDYTVDAIIMTCTFAITDLAYTLPVVDLFSIKFNVENWNNKFDFLYYTHGKEGKIVSKKKCSF